MPELFEVLDKFPLIGILRGITPERALVVGQLLYETGFRCLEIPMNSPEPLKSIEILIKNLGPEAIIGAGTVTNIEDVSAVHQHGGHFIIMPHTDSEIIHKAKSLNMHCIPGFSTPTEAWQAIKYQADALKFFPAANLSSGTLKAIKTILPKDIFIIPTGGITPENIVEFSQVGARAFAIGSELYRPEYNNLEIKFRALRFVEAIKKIK